MILYKRNAAGVPIQWEIQVVDDNSVIIKHGPVLGKLIIDKFFPKRNNIEDCNSRIALKRKEGYKEINELHDETITSFKVAVDVKTYLETYLPKFNTSTDGAILPMLAKTLEDNKPFIKHNYLGQWKINGERCLIGAKKANDMFHPYVFIFQSRSGTKWNLPYLAEILYKIIPQHIIELMVENGAYLDGEVYLPGYAINDINSFIKNPTMPQHKLLQFWWYDIAIENTNYIDRQFILSPFVTNTIYDKSSHLNNTNKLVCLPNNTLSSIDDATRFRNQFIDYGFEGLIIRNIHAEYGFDKRNMNMMKYKKLYDGLFKIINIVPEGVKRSNLPKFICQNDINTETFECTMKGSFADQEKYLFNKDLYIGKYAFVEYRERSGVKDAPFHAKIDHVRN